MIHASVEPSLKIAVLTEQGIVYTLNNRKFRSGLSSLRLLQETLRFSMAGISYEVHHFFTEQFERTLPYLQASGLVNYWIQNNRNAKSFSNQPIDPGPQVLTLEHLEIGFKVCLIPLFMATVCFIYEIINFKVYQAVLKQFRKILWISISAYKQLELN